MASELFVPREKSDNDCAWGDAFFIGPNEDIITCIEDGAPCLSYFAMRIGMLK